MLGKIYLIKNNINNMIYIGKTIRQGTSFENYWGSGLRIMFGFKWKYKEDK